MGELLYGLCKINFVVSIGVFVEKIGMGTIRGSLEVDLGGSIEGGRGSLFDLT